MDPGKLHITAALLFTISLNCCTCLSKDDTHQNQVHKKVQPLPPIPLPPGSAAIEAWMQDFSQEGSGFLCKVKVSQVNAYGPATPPLPQGYILTLAVPGELLEKNKYEKDKIFLRGKLLKISVKYLNSISDNGSAERWTATGFSDITQ